MSTKSILAGFASAIALLSSPLQARDDQSSFVQAAREVARGEAVLLDVREGHELVAEGMAEPAAWLATSEINDPSVRYRELLAAFPKDKPIYVYCASGRRAGVFTSRLLADGYRAINLGGFAAWKAADLPVRKLAEVKTAPCPYLCAGLSQQGPAGRP